VREPEKHAARGGGSSQKKKQRQGARISKKNALRGGAIVDVRVTYQKPHAKQKKGREDCACTGFHKRKKHTDEKCKKELTGESGHVGRSLVLGEGKKRKSECQ